MRVAMRLALIAFVSVGVALAYAEFIFRWLK